jgi:hypothetical protein
MATCLLFDGNSTNSTLIGIEYIISSGQYASLPEREKPNWTPVAEEEESEIRYPNLTPQQIQEVSEQFKDAYAQLLITWNPNDNLPLYPPQIVVESLIGVSKKNLDIPSRPVIFLKSIFFCRKKIYFLWQSSSFNEI